MPLEPPLDLPGDVAAPAPDQMNVPPEHGVPRANARVLLTKGGKDGEQRMTVLDVSEAPAAPSEPPAEASEEPTEPSEPPAEASEVPTEPGEAPAEASEAPAEASEVLTEASEIPAEPSEPPAEPS